MKIAEQYDDEGWRSMGSDFECPSCHKEGTVQFRLASYEPPVTRMEYQCTGCRAGWSNRCGFRGTPWMGGSQ